MMIIIPGSHLCFHNGSLRFPCTGSFGGTTLAEQESKGICPWGRKTIAVRPSVECRRLAGRWYSQIEMAAVSRRAWQFTLALIKPDAIAHPLVAKAVREEIKHNFFIVATKELKWKREDSESFYAEHQGRFFHQRLIEFTCSGPMQAYILAGENAVARWRNLMGPTKVCRAKHEAPDTIRGRYGLSDTRNCTHGSDSEISACREISFFFPEFDKESWLRNNANILNTNTGYT
uniref:Nucleoside diphosphate kinase n=1 Tax=Eptatretus burgeri TaxID=7764 RepID=A0A8C4PW38_EPTBU